MKSEKLIREMIEQFKFDIIAEALMQPVNEEKIKRKEEWIKCLTWVIEPNK